MKRIFIYTLLFFITGCSWDLPDRKSTKTCTKPTISNPTQVGTNKLQYTFSLFNIPDIDGNVTLSAPNLMILPQGSDKWTWVVTASIAGNYPITVSYTTTCGEKGTLQTSFNTSGCNQPSTTLTRNIDENDPAKTTFVLGGNTSDIDLKTVVWRNGGTVIANKSAEKRIFAYDFQRGTTYNIKVEYTLNCDTKIAEATTDPYTPKSCNAPNIVTVSVSSATQLIATLSGGDARDIKDNVTWMISPTGGQASGSNNSGVTFTDLNPDTEYTITADFTTQCGNKPNPLPSIKARTELAPVIDKAAWSATGTGNDNAWSMKVDANGNVYVAGFFTSPSINFGNGKVVTSGGNKQEVFVAKYNNQGVCQ